MKTTEILAAVVVLALAGLAGVWFAGRPPPPVPLEVEVSGSAVTERPSSITVHISGAVARPGLVRLEIGARVGDALAAAGGASSQADLGAVNLAASLTDGQQVVVPQRGAERAPGRSSSSPASPGPIHVNSADVAELETLPGVGPVLASRIVEFRDQHGPFEAVEDLLDVPGIGEGKLEALREALVVP